VRAGFFRHKQEDFDFAKKGEETFRNRSETFIAIGLGVALHGSD
jgi:hypothetical protein